MKWQWQGANKEGQLGILIVSNDVECDTRVSNGLATVLKTLVRNDSMLDWLTIGGLLVKLSQEMRCGSLITQQSFEADEYSTRESENTTKRIIVLLFYYLHYASYTRFHVTLSSYWMSANMLNNLCRNG